MKVWKMIFLFKGMIFRFHVSFLGGYSTDHGSSDTPFCSMFVKGFISTPEVCGESVGGDRHSQKVGKSKGL